MRTDEMKQVVAVVVLAIAMATTVVYAASKEGEKERSGESRDKAIVVEPRIVLEPRILPPLPPSPQRFDVDVWTDRQVYNLNDLVRVYFRVTRPCYVYIFNTDTRGVTHQIFPNYFDRDNLCMPGGSYFIPGADPFDARYNLRVVGPPGTEELRIVAVRYRPVYYERRFRFSVEAPFPVFAEGAKGLVNEYQRGEKKADQDAAKISESRGATRREMMKEEPRTRETAPQDKSKGGAAEPKSREKIAAGGQRETIVIEPVPPRPEPRRVVVEPPRPAVVYDRDYVEDYVTFQVVDPYWQPAPEYGRVSVNSSPAGALVVIDGAARGRTPLLVGHLEPGIHTIEVSFPGYHTFVEAIEVFADQPAVVNVRLRPQRMRWSFDFGW